MKARAGLLTALATVIGLLLVAGVVAAAGVGTGGSTNHRRTVALAPTTTSTTMDQATTTTTTASPPVSPQPSVWAVGAVSYPFVDRSRPTGPTGSDPGEAFRNLPTVVRYPALGQSSPADAPGAAPDRKNGPFPLIVFAHGYNASPGTYAALLHTWASAGYVVAAPAFPRATQGGPLDEGDLLHQPGDVSFVLGQVIGLARSGQALAGMVDPTRVAVAGHSDGASTAVGVGYSDCCHDGRVRADLVMEGDAHTFAIGRPPGVLPALFVVQGDSDSINPPQYGSEVFDDGPTPKFLLWLLHAQHLEPFTTDQPHLTVVEAATVAFFDRYLKTDAGALDRMRAAATPGLATLRTG